MGAHYVRFTGNIKKDTLITSKRRRGIYWRRQSTGTETIHSVRVNAEREAKTFVKFRVLFTQGEWVGGGIPRYADQTRALIH